MTGLARFGSVQTLSVYNESNFGSTLSLRSFGRFGSHCSVLGASIQGSSMSVRRAARFGHRLTLFDQLQMGSSLSLRSYMNIGSGVSMSPLQMAACSRVSTKLGLFNPGGQVSASPRMIMRLLVSE